MNFEEQQFSEIQNGTPQLQTDIADGVNSFVPALAFIGKYTTAIGNGIKDYIIVFMLPYLPWHLLLCLQSCFWCHACFVVEAEGGLTCKLFWISFRTVFQLIGFLFLQLSGLCKQFLKWLSLLLPFTHMHHSFLQYVLVLCVSLTITLGVIRFLK